MTPSAFIKKWRHRIDFVRREGAAQARGLTSLALALTAIPPGTPRPVVLVGSPVAAHFLKKLGPIGGLAAIDVHIVSNQASLDSVLTLHQDYVPLVVAADVYARFHAELVSYVREERLFPA